MYALRGGPDVGQGRGQLCLAILSARRSFSHPSGSYLQGSYFTLCRRHFLISSRNKIESNCFTNECARISTSLCVYLSS